MKPRRIAPADNRQSAELVRTAVRKAIRETEEEWTRLAYLDQPDAEAEADEWSSAEQWNRDTGGMKQCEARWVSLPEACGRSFNLGDRCSMN
jgi:hypothetical protein